MADVQDANTSAEPSMEEILASIRRIIADEKAPAAESAPGEDVLELTQMVQDDGSIVDVSEPAAPEPEAVFEAVPAPEPEPEPIPAPAPAPAPVFDEGDGLLSNRAADAAASSLAALVSTVQTERRATLPSYTPLGNSGRTLEDMVMELMRPMLKSWLDENLPPIVDRLVQKEVERIARKLQE